MLQRFQIGDDVANLIGIEAEFGHGRVTRDDALRERLLEILHRIAGMQRAERRPIGNGLGLTLSMPWQREQFACTSTKPRCAGGDNSSLRAVAIAKTKMTQILRRISEVRIICPLIGVALVLRPSPLANIQMLTVRVFP